MSSAIAIHFATLSAVPSHTTASADVGLLALIAGSPVSALTLVDRVPNPRASSAESRPAPLEKEMLPLPSESIPNELRTRLPAESKSVLNRKNSPLESTTVSWVTIRLLPFAPFVGNASVSRPTALVITSSLELVDSPSDFIPPRISPSFCPRTVFLFAKVSSIEAVAFSWNLLVLKVVLFLSPCRTTFNLFLSNDIILSYQSVFGQSILFVLQWKPYPNNIYLLCDRYHYYQVCLIVVIVCWQKTEYHLIRMQQRTTV